MTKNAKRKDFPETCTLKVAGQGRQGDFYAYPTDDNLGLSDCKFYIIENRKIKPPLETGDEFVGRIFNRKGAWWAKPVVRMMAAGVQPEKLYGIVEKRGKDYYLKAADKQVRMDYLLESVGDAKNGDFVSVALTGDRRFKQAHVIKNFGAFDLNKATSALVLEKYDIPMEFNDKITKELQDCKNFNRDGRLDLTNVPLVTIDGEDARDFDDAIWAEKTQNGFNLMVAIADVSFYVRPGTELDREAYKRGNSVYLPNVVIPMLPEMLCNGLCSLQPQQLRASIVCLMEIDKNGKLLSYDFKRAVIKSAARLTYKEVQQALDGEKSANIAPVFKTVVEPLYEAFQALEKARKKRGALELVTNEIKIKVGKNGEIISINKDIQYTAHKIVEEFMITANVAAALALGKSKLPVLYRVHDKPIEDKLKDIEPLLHNLGLKLPDMPALKPEHFNKIIELCSKNGYAQGISDTVLRLQSQAQYSPVNIGHFGLGLTDYAHFTSPIRRYADLLIHRTLVKAMQMPDGGELEDTAKASVFEDIGQHLCETERKAAGAERDIQARFISAYLKPSIGHDFEVKLVGMCRAGIFVRIDTIGAEGLIPFSSMPYDEYILAAGNVEVSGRLREFNLRLGDTLNARLMEASPISGGLIFKYIDPEEGLEYFEKGNRRPSQNDLKHPKQKKDVKKSVSARKKRKEKIKKANKKEKGKCKKSD